MKGFHGLVNMKAKSFNFLERPRRADIVRTPTIGPPSLQKQLDNSFEEFPLWAMFLF